MSTGLQQNCSGCGLPVLAGVTGYAGPACQCRWMQQDHIREAAKMVRPELPAIPFGKWDLMTGKWHPNPALSMSEEAQRQHNIKHGFLKKGDAESPSDNDRPSSQLIRDGVPTFYISLENPAIPLTHRQRDSDIPVWCKDSADGLEAMRRISGEAVRDDGVRADEQILHWSDCALFNEPAKPAGQCDCGGYTKAPKEKK